jgi:tagatose-1,6-bisphosphate aldolase non-catalytic subunit AgaZ/GatZ
MVDLKTLLKQIASLRQKGGKPVTLLAACPNSAAVLEAAVKCAAVNNTPMLFAATLNQVDRDGGYTRWTPAEFVRQVQVFADKYAWEGPLYPCLDHGGPWLKDRHTLDGLSFEQTFQEVKLSLTACLEAGYQLLHIDPTVDRSLPPGAPVPVEMVVARTVELIAHAENERRRLGLPQVVYEVGTEEVHGGLVDFANFNAFLVGLRQGLDQRDLGQAWPGFIVARVGTDLATTFFDPEVACRAVETAAPYGSLIKGHYTDWVENPQAYPASGMGGANVGPEFTAEEVRALQRLCETESELRHQEPQIKLSHFMQVLEQAVVDSGRWKKWLEPGEKGLEFRRLGSARRAWLVETGARYIWTEPAVEGARQKLYNNLHAAMPDPHEFVVDRIVAVMDKYVDAFNLMDLLGHLGS